MKIWLDAQLSPEVARWMEEAFEIEEAFAVQLDAALRAATDLVLPQGEPLVEISDLE